MGNALVQEDCARTIVGLLESEKPELVHRALVIITELLAAQEGDAEQCRAIAVHLIEGGVVQAISVVLKLKDAQLGKLAKEAASALSSAVSVSQSTRG